MSWSQELLNLSADPESAQRAADRLKDALHVRTHTTLSDEDWRRLWPLLDCEAPASRMVLHPRWATWLTRGPWIDRERPARSFATELASRTAALSLDDAEGLDRILRLYRHREMCRIILRDQSRRASLRVVLREISHLADALVEAAVRFWDASLARRYGAPLGDGFCVIAMGKHGAQELNYSSDIDVLFVFDQDGQTPSGKSRRDQAMALARAVIKSLSAPTSNGIAFRVDANLRPYGRDGQLAQSLDEMERYYERAGQTWERAALIKARPCAGGLDVGTQLLERLTPFVFRRTLDLDAVRAIAEMKRQIDLDGARSADDNVKLGFGGIREIEFFAQALQLLHGGREPRLRLRSTLGTLEALVHAGHLTTLDLHVFSDAYVFLRDTEHRLQFPGDQQTHSLPDPTDTRAREILARRMGFERLEDFERTLAVHRRNVRSRFENLFSTAAGDLPISADAETAATASKDDSVRVKALAALGFAEPERAFEDLRRLGRQPEGVFGLRGAERYYGLAGRLLDEIARSADPDLALFHLARLLTSLWNPAIMTTLFASDPAATRRLILLFSSSEALTRDFHVHPDLLEVLVKSSKQSLVRARSELTEEIDARLKQAPSVEDALATLRTLRREEVLRVGLQDLAGQLSSFAVGHQLTFLAEEVLRQVLNLARQEVSARFGEPESAELSVLGFGSLGGAELDYESDLDLVFVHNVRGQTSGGERGIIEAGEWAAKVSQRLVSFLTMPSPEGVLYRVDTRLRPSGTQGPLVASFEAFAGYHGVGPSSEQGARGGDLWERQALLRARPVAGDRGLCARITTEVLEASLQRPLPAETAASIREMRYRLDDVRDDGALAMKKGKGGLLDIDFIVQFLQLKTRLRSPSSREGLRALIKADAIPRELGEDLLQAHLFLRHIESRLRLMYGRSDVFVPRTGPGLVRLARQLGDIGAGAPERLWQEVTRTMGRTREIFDQVLSA